MRLHTITETPHHVDQYPEYFAKEAIKNINQIKIKDLHQFWTSNNISLAEDRFNRIYIIIDNKPIGVIELLNTEYGYGVFNVFILPEYRNQQLGKLLYKQIALNKGPITARTNMTPDSRRVYTSLMKDPELKIYAIHLQTGTKLPVHVGPKGIATGNGKKEYNEDHYAYVIEKK